MSKRRLESMRAAIYARVSTEEQKTDLQLHDLRQFVSNKGWTPIEYTESESSVKTRPVLEQMLSDARAGKIDIILVWKIDRFARSIKQFVEMVLELDGLDVQFYSITQNIGSYDKSPMARFLMHLFAALAELERGMILDRVQAGIAQYQRNYAAGRARSRSGKNLPIGRPRRVFRRDRALEMRRAGKSWSEIAAQLGVSTGSVRRACQ